MKIRLLALAFGFFVAAGTAHAGPTPGGADTDGDTVENAFDNCTTVSNSDQADTDHNGCGNACTLPINCDFTGDLIVGAPDRAVVGSNFTLPVPIGTAGDCSGMTPGVPDGTVGAPDLALVGLQFTNRVGPSGITTAQCNPSTCICTPQ